MRTEIFIALQLIVAIGLINVWLVRFNKSTSYRGGSANNLKEEFAAYGLPPWAFYLIGILKLSVAALLIIGIWLPILIPYTAALLAILMLGAISMHVKVQDPIMKSLPAAVMLCFSLILVFGSLGIIY